MAFKHFFGQDLAVPFRNLTPADFALVAKKAGILGVEAQDDIFELLKSEAASKNDNRAVVGFMA
jgi:hypothetical protein